MLFMDTKLRFKSESLQAICAGHRGFNAVNAIAMKV